MMVKKADEIKRRRTTVAQHMNKSQVGAICAICTLEFEPGDKVMVLGCHATHMLHEECFKELDKFCSKNVVSITPLTCPICRKPVDKEKIVKKKLLEAEANVTVYDPFKIEAKTDLPVVLTPDNKVHAEGVTVLPPE